MKRPETTLHSMQEASEALREFGRVVWNEQLKTALKLKLITKEQHDKFHIKKGEANIMIRDTQQFTDPEKGDESET